MISAFTIACLGVGGCSDLAPSTSHQSPPVILNSSQVVEDVSLVQLLAVPERFHERRVRLIGYLHLAFEGNGLSSAPPTVAWAKRTIPNLDVVALGPAGHHAPEDAPDAIATAITAWLARR